MNLYTKKGRPLQVADDIVFSKSGKVVGKIQENKVYDPAGQYVGTIVTGYETYHGIGDRQGKGESIPNDRLAYRSPDAAGSGSAFSAEDRAAFDKETLVGQVMWGDEPKTPD